MAGERAVFPPCGVAGASSSSQRLSICIVALLLLGLPSAHSQKDKMYLDTTDLNILVDLTQLINLVQIGEYNTSLIITPVILHPDIVQLVPTPIKIPASDNPNATANITHQICAYGKSPGHSEVTFNVTPSGFLDVDSLFLRVVVMHSNIIYVISYIMGWIYFVAWSVSFYPQIYINFKRKSVVGLNFDFLALNIMGFTMYSLFNCGLYFSEEIQAEYFSRYPRGHNPVQLNDVFFSLHAAFATLITIAQCFLYEREDQRVSYPASGILGIFWVVVIISGSIAAAGVIQWLDFLNYCSYIKLCITLIKYLPQAYMNYQRKSTEGWSIGNIILDFTGGFLSILQMMLNAYNYNDWVSIFGDFTKFGLGAISLVFDIFFMLQHYVFYRVRNDFIMVKSSDDSSEMSSAEGRDFFLMVNDKCDTGITRYVILPGENEGEYRYVLESEYEANPRLYQGAPDSSSSSASDSESD